MGETVETPNTDVKTFGDALKRLNIEDYEQRICCSNSHGELFHLLAYIYMAQKIKGDVSWFRPAFLACVEFAEKNWDRPESVFQHMPRMIHELLTATNDQDKNA